MSERRPVIGICAALEAASWAVWHDVDANVSQRTYSLRVAEAGAIPILLPADEASAKQPDELLDLLDGLLLSGGADLDPASYGAEPDPRTLGYRRERDRFELALAARALERELPLLAVCRGMQVLNVARGGSLEQHLDDAELHVHTPGQFADHSVRLAPGSLAARVVGADTAAVRSHHHQGVAELGEGVVASGWAEPGGTIEAIEIPDRRFAVGLLWHPEEEPGSAAVSSFVNSAREERVSA